MKFNFGNVVIVDDNLVGVVVKSWADGTHEIYVRFHNKVKFYQEDKIQHFIFDKIISEDQLEYYK